MDEEIKRRCEELYLAEVKNCVHFTSIKADYVYDPIANCLYIFVVLSDVGWITFVRYKFDSENFDYVEREYLTAPSGSIEILKNLLCNF